ncbi:hypothetical protein GQ54DRAFT_164073 [Martensiomyces pterosporus]|nr:hypothetical protein GQ54DRAFT_164073 [Martensiomyces pterosporus]
MPDTPLRTGDAGSGVAAEMPPTRNSISDGSEVALPGHSPTRAARLVVATTAAGAASSPAPHIYSLGGGDEEVLGGGNIVVNSSSNNAGGGGALNGSGTGDGVWQAASENAPASSSSPAHGALLHRSTAASGHPNGAFRGYGSEEELPLAPSLGVPSLLPSSPTSSKLAAATLIPPSLQNSTVYDVLLAGGNAGTSSAFDAFPSHDGGDDEGASMVSDSWPVSSPDDYLAISQEARRHWRARAKQPTSAVEQSRADVRDFMSGSPRRRLRLVLIQLHDLIDRTPRIYDILECKKMLEDSAASQARLERSLNSLWSELKVRCSLLILDKDTAQAVVHQSPLAEEDECPDKVAFVQSLVASVVKDVIENTPLLWESFDAAVRGLVLVGSGKAALSSIAHASGAYAEVEQNFVKVLLEAYAVLPDVYKSVIRSGIEAVASNGERGARLVTIELRRYRVLPGVLFRTLAKHLVSARADEARRYLDGLLHTGAAAWIGRAANGGKPAYSQVGSEIHSAVYAHFYHLGAEMQRQHVLSYIRVVSGLVGYLRIETQSEDYAFFQRAAKLAAADDIQAMDACAALLLTLVGYGAQVTAHDTLQAITGISSTGTARRIDCLLAQLLTDHVEEVGAFVSRALHMDFAYPRERLFYLKDIMSQSKIAYLSSASIARRLVHVGSPQLGMAASDASSELCRAAVLSLLQNNVFQDEGVDVREWFTHAARSLDTQSANKFGALVKSYVGAIFSSAAVTPIPESILWKAFAAESIGFAHGHQVPPSQVLFLLYILYYCERLLEQPRKPSSAFSSFGKRSSLGQAAPANVPQPRNNGPFGFSVGTPVSRSSSVSSPAPNRPGTGRSSPFGAGYGAARRGEYSDQLLDSLPVSWVLQHVSNSVEYQQIWPELLSMATAQYPDQLEVVSVLQRELAANIVQDASLQPSCEEPMPAEMGTSSGFIRQARSAREFIEGRLAARADAIQAQQLLRFMEEYVKLPVAVRMGTCETLTTAICSLAIARPQESELTAIVRRVWYMAHTLSPHAVSAATINAWRAESGAAKPKLITQDIWLDPLVVFRSDPRVFQSPDLADILLTILSEFLILSKTNMRRLFKLRQRDSGALKQPHIIAMIQLQETGAVQLLIEISRLVRSESVRRLIFGFIHARFLEQRTIQKLIHFQAYDIATIRDMVDCVPSMHACSEFIPELLMQSSPRLQHFAIELAAAITSKYPIVANEGMAKEVILPHVQTTLAQIAGTAVADQLVISNAMLRAVITINSAFPAIHDDCAKLLKAVRDVANDRAHGIFQNAQQQSGDKPAQSASQQLKLNIARWIVCCDRVISITADSSKPSGHAAYTPIEDIDAADMLARLESSFRAEKKSSHSGPGRSGSPALPGLASQQQQQQSGQQQQQQPGQQKQQPQQGSPRPPMPPPLPPFHNDHQQQQGQQQYGVPPNVQKRPHSSMSGERSPRPGPPPPPPGAKRDGSPMEYGGRSRGAGGGVPPPRGGPPVPDSMMMNGGMMQMRPSMPPPHLMDHGPGGGPNHGGSSNFSKKRNRHRSRVLGKDGGGGGGSNTKPGQGPKRSRNSGAGGGDRPRSKDR